MSNQVRRLIHFLLFMLMLGSAFFCTASPESIGGDDTVARIHNMVKEIKQIPDDLARTQSTSELADFILKLNKNQIESIAPELVGEIASLLRDKFIGVKSFAAVALGNIGPRAMSAVPELEKSVQQVKAEEDAEWIQPSVPNTLSFYRALNKIDGRSMPQKP